MKRTIGLCTALMLMIGALLGLSTTAASAHTKSVTANCVKLDVNLTRYATHTGADNWVKVTIDGDLVTDQEFDGEFVKSYGWDPAKSHTWKVEVWAWDDPYARVGWTFTKTGTTTPCQPPRADVEYSEGSSLNCQTDTVTITKRKRSRSYTWDGDSWEPGQWSPWTVYLTGHRPATDRECPPPPTVTKRHVRVKVAVRDECNCWRDSVRMIADRSKVSVKALHPNKTTWKFVVTGRRVQGPEGPFIQYQLPETMRGSFGWANRQVYKVRTTNKVCPCHRRGDCEPLRHNHDTCAAGIRRGTGC